MPAVEDRALRRYGGRRREAVQVLLALAIISAAAGLSAALSALGLLPQRQRSEPKPRVFVIVVVNDLGSSDQARVEGSTARQSGLPDEHRTASKRHSLFSALIRLRTFTLTYRRLQGGSSKRQ
jgi:hypothetical protein